MKMKDTTRRSVRFLFSIRRYLIFFLLMAFVITCCMILFLNMMTRATGFELTQEYIEQAAKVTFLNVALLSLLCTVIDGIRRRIMVKRPVKRIVSAAEQIMKGDFSVRIPSLRSADKMSGFDVIADYFNQMAEELSGTETLRTECFPRAENAAGRHSKLRHLASAAELIGRKAAGICQSHHQYLPSARKFNHEYFENEQAGKPADLSEGRNLRVGRTAL